MIGFVDPDSGFGILISVNMVVVAALGGVGTLFGPLGVLFATPLALVLHTLITMLYRQDVLGDPKAKAPGEK